MRQLIKRATPASWIQGLHDFRSGRAARLVAERRARKARSQAFTHDQLVTLFSGLGIQPGDTIFVHSGLGAFNRVEGGAATIVQGLKAAIGDTGTLAFPAFPAWGTMMKERPVFDAAKTPSAVGALAEFFRLLPGVVRSLHPTHSVCALGERAAWLVEGHETRSYAFGPGTPFFRLCEARGKILMLGVGIYPLTATHTAEDLIAPSDSFLPVYQELPLEFQLRDVSGATLPYRGYFHSSTLIPRRNVERMRQTFSSYNIMRTQRTDYSELVLIDAQGLQLTLLSEFQRGNSIYGRVSPRRADRARVGVAYEHLVDQLGFRFG